jgi:CheY-like chemotaxis protein
MKSGSLYILLVDDDPDDRDLFCSRMQQLYPQIGIHTFQDGDELLDFLDNCTYPTLPAFILIDYKMPLFTAPQILQTIGTGTRFAQSPKIVWSTSQRQQDIDECLNLGAVRFAIKPDTDRQLDLLINSFEEWLITPILSVPANRYY